MKAYVILLFFCLLFYGCGNTYQFLREDNIRAETSSWVVEVDGKLAVEKRYDHLSNVTAYFWLKGYKISDEAFTLMIDADKDGEYETIFYDVDYDGWFDKWVKWVQGEYSSFALPRN